MEKMRIIEKVSVDDIEKKTFPDKHYEYVIRVHWSDGTVIVVYRRYSRLFTLQSRLLDKFPKHAGIYNPSDRIIPFLPGKIFFGRSQIRRVALDRQEKIDHYCKELIRLIPEISECKEVLNFFEPNEFDLRPTGFMKKNEEFQGESISDPVLLEQYYAIDDYKRDGRDETSLRAGSIVDVVEKNETGWWFVNTDDGQGWVPSSYLEKTEGDDDRILSSKGSKYICTHDYDSTDSDEISLRKGAYVHVVEKNLDGWWLVRCQGQEGRAPSTYLSPIDSLKAKRILKRSLKVQKSNADDKESPATINEIRRKARENAKENARNTRVSRFVNNPAQVTQVPIASNFNQRNGDDSNARNTHNPVMNSQIRQAKNKLTNTTGQQDDLNASFKAKLAQQVDSNSAMISSRDRTGNWLLKSSDERFRSPSERPGNDDHRSRPLPPPKQSKPVTVHSHEEDQQDYEQLDYENAGVWMGGGANLGEESHQPMIAEQMNSNESLASIDSTTSEEDSTNENKIPPRRKTLRESAARSSGGDFDNVIQEHHEEYHVTTSYVNEAGDGIDLVAGETVEVLEKTEVGWWFVKARSGEGWAPAAFIRKLERRPSAQGPKRPPQPKSKQSSSNGTTIAMANIAQRNFQPQSPASNRKKMDTEPNGQVSEKNGHETTMKAFPNLSEIRKAQNRILKPPTLSQNGGDDVVKTGVKSEKHGHIDIVSRSQNMKSSQETKTNVLNNRNDLQLHDTGDFRSVLKSALKPQPKPLQPQNKMMFHSQQVAAEEYENEDLIEQIAKTGPPVPVKVVLQKPEMQNSNQRPVKAQKPTLPGKKPIPKARKNTGQDVQQENAANSVVANHESGSNRVNKMKHLFEKS